MVVLMRIFNLKNRTEHVEHGLVRLKKKKLLKFHNNHIRYSHTKSKNQFNKFILYFRKIKMLYFGKYRYKLPLQDRLGNNKYS